MFSRCLCGHTPTVQNMHRVKLPGNFKLSISEASEYEWLSVSLCQSCDKLVSCHWVRLQPFPHCLEEMGGIMTRQLPFHTQDTIIFSGNTSFITFNNVTRKLSLFLKQARLDADWSTIIFGVHLEIMVKVQIRIGGHMRNQGCCGTVLFYFPTLNLFKNTEDTKQNKNKSNDFLNIFLIYFASISEIRSVADGTLQHSCTANKIYDPQFLQ